MADAFRRRRRRAVGEDAISSGPLKAKKDTLARRGREGRPTDRADLGEGKFPAHSLFLGGELNLFLANSRKQRHSVTPKNAGSINKTKLYLPKFYS